MHSIGNTENPAAIPTLEVTPTTEPASGHRLHLMTAIADAEAAGFAAFAEALKAQYAEEFAR